MALDLLHDRLIQSDRGWHSLPGLFAAKTAGAVAAFPALRPHQRPAWHMFLVQLAVMALDAAGRRELPQGEEDWRAALRCLTPAFPDDAPWHLLGSDPARPAFLQPPDPGGLKWTDVATPDALDMVITSRNHDVKREIARAAAPQDWIFALVSLQTMEAYGGRDNHGVARMNGGFSSRVMIGLAPARPGSSQIDPSSWWARDVGHLLTGRSGVTGKALLWLDPWPDGQSFALDALDPLFIEVCRRVRLVIREGLIAGLRSTSKAARVAGKEAFGNTGDPWAPLRIVDGAALTLNATAEGDWTHKLLTELLFSAERKWQVPPLALRSAADATGPMLLVAEAFSRGNSKTDGFRSRVVPVPQAIVAWVFGTRPREVSDGILKDIAAVDRALRDGLATVAAGGAREKVAKPHYARSLPARDVLRRAADALFFDALWARAAATSDAEMAPLRLGFLEALARVARVAFERAAPGIPCPSLLRPRAEVRGRQAMERGLHFAMRDLKQTEAADA